MREDNSDSDLILFNRVLRSGDERVESSAFTYNVRTGEETRLTPFSVIPYSNIISAESWSNNGTRILARKRYSNGITHSYMTLDADGQNLRHLIDATQISVYVARWSRKDEWIIFWGSPLQEKASDRYWAIFDIPTDGGAIRRLSQPFTKTNGSGLSISPDGSQIIFSIGDGTLFTMSPNSDEAIEIPIPLDVGGTLEWSPDGTQIAVLASGKDDESQFGGIYIISPDGRDRRLLVANREGMEWPSTVKWSPDGSQLLFFLRAKGVDGKASLNFVSTTTGVIRTYPADEGILSFLTELREVIWSPDGKQIALSAGSINSYMIHLYLLDSDLTQIQRIADGERHIAFGEFDDWVVQWQPKTR